MATVRLAGTIGADRLNIVRLACCFLHVYHLQVGASFSMNRLALLAGHLGHSHKEMVEVGSYLPYSGGLGDILVNQSPAVSEVLHFHDVEPRAQPPPAALLSSAVNRTRTSPFRDSGYARKLPNV